AGDDEAHEDREVVDEQVEWNLEGAALDPGPVREIAGQLVGEQDQCRHERRPHDARADDHGDDPRKPPAAAGEQDRAGGGEDEDQQRDSASAHPFGWLRSWMSWTSRWRTMSPRIASPTTASDHA